MKIKRYTSILLIFFFLMALGVSSCGNSKKTHTKVKSKSGMGNKKDKNKHVWGK